MGPGHNVVTANNENVDETVKSYQDEGMNLSRVPRDTS